MIQLIIEVSESNGITVNLSAQQDKPTPQEKLFAAQMAKTISDFLSGAPKADNLNAKLSDSASTTNDSNRIRKI